MKRRVVVDVDAGSDDAVAILLLLTSELENDFSVLGITCTHGNTTVDNVCRNVLITLESINRLDVPVFRGAECSLVSQRDFSKISNYFHGKDGFGDLNFPPPKGKVQTEVAVEALNRIAVENEGISLICLGPLTNIALAIRTYPNFSKYLREIFIMGGNVHGIGNETSAAEFNFYTDPEAAQIVLSSLECPVTLLPWECCIKPNFTLEERLKEVGSSSASHIQLLNKIESKIYSGQEVWNPCDAFLASVFIDKSTVENFKALHLSVELHGLHTRGQGVVDHLQRKKPNINVVQKLDIKVFKKLVMKMASFTPK